ncbi:FMN-linked oxidoreductase [Tilletiaria anomala UBC 951]|uniref:tRNA-dihydrouridine(47) synthase [NAD(P)(+)] n=1 Tax=Tilletiaria anomala (strain ATCC 24038 / CBS 436.72 / UBC 951) TaxID=1037660 RepID=A0A066WMV4_TILAU|nr:FMN-linked oxidoreductase [Tilletiaria anomala UBC 951]KDN51960.1 FMN-linked oxidoreductase [Tilletiaria anomala UBC 951]
MAQVRISDGVVTPSGPYTPGIAPIKPEFVVRAHGSRGGDARAASSSATVTHEREKSHAAAADEQRQEEKGAVQDDVDDDLAEASMAMDQPGAKRPKLKGSARRRAKREEHAAQVAAAKAAATSEGVGTCGGKSGQRGQNKNRKFGKIGDDISAGLCDSIMKPQPCKFGGPPPKGKCFYEHDVERYLKVKKQDISFPAPPPPPVLEDVDEKVRFSKLGLLSVPGKSTVDGLSSDAQHYLDSHYSTQAPFCKWNNVPDLVSETELENNDSADTTADCKRSLLLDGRTYCTAFHQLGDHCPAGWRCRFLGAHVKVLDEKSGGTAEESSIQIQEETRSVVKDVQLLRKKGFVFREENEEQGKSTFWLGEYNWVGQEKLKALRKREYLLPRTNAVLARLETENTQLALPQRPITLSPEEVEDHRVKEDRRVQQRQAGKEQRQQQHAGRKRKGDSSARVEEVDLDDLENEMRAQTAQVPQTQAAEAKAEAEAGAQTSSGDGLIFDLSSIDTARIRPSEKRRLRWKGELYLAPLTTTGNLPFRKLCSTFGSDIHCGEMGLAESYLQGNSSEWSLVRRWEGERIFGTQLCGSRPDLLVPVAEALYNECGDALDFVDLNCGCPIDMVFNRGGGSALMDHPNKLGKILRGMSAVLGEIPVTIKMRTGTSSKVNTAHKLFARVQTEFAVGAATLHGRSRQQRYKNLADWSYVRECASTLREAVREHNESARTADKEEMVPIPIYGNGDVYSWEDYYANLEHTGVDGEMLARGALIKPWLFTEIKERRSWDISSRERLDMVRRYASYGLSHWGSDTQGVNLTRRFLCEAISFWHRYVPHGLLEYVPPRINDRPPIFKGRDELETLLASGNSNDWVKISEMFLGKAPADWNFIPKHKSNSYSDAAENQG